MASESVLRQCQLDIKAALVADSWMSGVEVTAQDEGDLDNKITIALGRLGIHVAVMMAKARCSKPNLPGPVLDQIVMVVEVAENVELNRGAGGTGKTCLAVIERCLVLVHQKVRIADKVVVAHDETIAPAPNPRGATCTYQCAFRTQDGIKLSQHVDVEA